jgi:hypothetical protein
VSVVEAVDQTLQQEAFDEVSKIPSFLKGYMTFFGEYDYWLFMTVEPSDDRICFSCQVLDKMIFTGLELRSAFPFLIIEDGYTIRAFVHPNCRCVLIRITNPMDYLALV